ncbi:hypothetical protein [Pseudonocardia xishanensis]|uniref:P-loop NTPase fold protein n=1 Tax=Pseudonocardia xishanensis TaxID=630995 RepID=A0ABP8S245_9PSEU
MSFRNRGAGGQGATSLSLLPLTPTYDRTKHGTYLDALERALSSEADSVKNIALTGSYGVGKSSVLQEIARRHKKRVVSISLSTLGSINEQITEKPAESDFSTTNKATTTNAIQKEIVKQLLYSQDPVRMPGSRYRRIVGFRAWRELAFAILAGIPLTATFFLTSWTDKIAALAPLGFRLGAWAHLIVFSLGVALIFGIRKVFHNRLRIEKVSAGAATISLSSAGTTYFDEYLDEIVYFFEEVGVDIVIFEDIDRFDNAHIFETLRALNTILNGAKQLRGRDVRFIYAIKDSIFEDLGLRAAQQGGDPSASSSLDTTDTAAAEIARANRTKFFDLVIPVVPFITHRSARDLFVSTFEDLDHDISVALIDLASRHVADMRLIKNIRNEFAVFKQHVIDSGGLELNQDGLLAMILYKNIHLRDFEQIRFRNSKLDALYRESRQIVQEGITSANAEIRRLRDEIRETQPALEFSERLGAALLEQIEQTRETTRGQIISRTYNGSQISDQTLRSPSFWETFSAQNNHVEVSIRSMPNQYPISFYFTRDWLSRAIGESIESSDWVDDRRERANAGIEAAQAEVRFLTKADMKDLLARGEFSLNRHGECLSFQEIAKRTLTSELASELVAAGYIDRNFTLYTSTFYENRVSANATNYLIKNVDPNIVDFYYLLEPADIESIIRERSKAWLREPSARNISLLDYLLANRPEDAHTVVAELTSYGAEERDFLLGYMDSGTRRSELAINLAKTWSNAVNFLISEASVEDSIRYEVVNSALQVLSPDITYSVDDAVRQFVQDNYGKLDVFTSDKIDPLPALGVLLRDLGVQLSNLDVLSPRALTLVVDVGTYAVSRANLAVALAGTDSSPTLDFIRSVSEAVYRRTIQDVPAFIAALEADEASISNSTEFILIICDVWAVDPKQVGAVVERASMDCLIESLPEVETDIWPVLARNRRFSLDLANVHNYISELSIDEPLAGYLQEARRIEASDSEDEASKQIVATSIINASQHLRDPAVRVELVDSLDLANHIDLASIPLEAGHLVGLLVAADIVIDSAETFSRLAPDDEDGREFAISRSTRFLDFMTTTELPPAFIGTLFKSAIIPDEIKNAVAQRLSEFSVTAPLPVLETASSYAARVRLHLPLTEVARLVNAGIATDDAMSLLEPHLNAMTMSDLSPILAALGGEYSRLSEKNGKRPKLASTPANRLLAKRLKELEFASSFQESGGSLRVQMRRP